jgi:hypothetical protein
MFSGSCHEGNERFGVPLATGFLEAQLPFG